MPVIQINVHLRTRGWIAQIHVTAFTPARWSLWTTNRLGVQNDHRAGVKAITIKSGDSLYPLLHAAQVQLTWAFAASSNVHSPYSAMACPLVVVLPRFLGGAGRSNQVASKGGSSWYDIPFVLTRAGLSSKPGGGCTVLAISWMTAFTRLPLPVAPACPRPLPNPRPLPRKVVVVTPM